MSVAFIDVQPTDAEIQRLMLIMSTFSDGSGQEKDKDGKTRLGWRDLERVVASLLKGVGPENKEIFDVVVPNRPRCEEHYGISVKSKGGGPIDNLDLSGRVYMELCNSPAKLWNALKPHGLSEEDFRKKRSPQKIGDIILQTVTGWHHEYKRLFDALTHGRTLNLEKSIYLTVSYEKAPKGKQRRYQLHAFNMSFPEGLKWSFTSDKCLRANDPAHPKEALFDWYGLSGGQLKYYPRASTAKFRSPIFSLLEARVISLEEKASRSWPKEWAEAGGEQVMSPDTVVADLAVLAELAQPKQRAILLETIQKLRAR